MANASYFDGQRGVPGFLTSFTAADGSVRRAVIPAVALTDTTGASAGAGTSSSPTISQSQGTASLATTQVSCGTSATQLVAARAGRNAVTITNITGAQQVFVGPSTVTATGATGGALLPATVGASITIPTSAAVYGIALTAAQTVSVLETF